MTEVEWQASDDPQAMLLSLQREWDKGGTYCVVSDRKLRLLACACVRQVWHRLSDHQRASVVFAESEPWHQAALGGVHAVYTSQDAITEYTRSVGDGRCINYAIGWLGAQSAHEVASQSPAWLQRLVSLPTQAALLRDIVGDPFRPVVLPCECHCGPREWWPVTGECANCGAAGWCPWLTPQVLSLAQAAYDERQDDATLDPDRLAILADALEEAGCTNEALLRHLRGWEWSPPEDHMGRDKGVWIRLRGPHVRGCWALDLILGKN